MLTYARYCFNRMFVRMVRDLKKSIPTRVIEFWRGN